MYTAIRLIFTVLLVILMSHQNTSAQIIRENKLVNTPYTSILQSSDSEYIYIGSQGNPGKNEYDVVLRKIDLSGNLVWEKLIRMKYDYSVKDASILSDNTIIIGGGVRQSIYESSPFLMKTDAKGDTLWTRHYETGHEAEKVIATFDGGFLFAYFSDSAGIVKTDSNGSAIWSKKIGKGKPFGLAETSEAVYILADNEDDNIVINSIDSDGEVIWKRVFGGSGTDQPSDILNAFNGDDYVFAGKTNNRDSGDDVYLGSLDCFGYATWAINFGGKGTDWSTDLMQTSDGDFLAVGSSNSFNDDGYFDFYALKINAHGKTVWSKTIPILENGNFVAQKIFETSYGSYVIAGSKISASPQSEESYLLEFIYPTIFDISFESDQKIINSSSAGVEFFNLTRNAEYYDFVWDFGDGQTLASNDNNVFHEYTEDGSYTVKLTAFERDFGSVDSLVNYNYILVSGISTSSAIVEFPEKQLLSIYPNPFSSSTLISFDNPDNDVHTLRIRDQKGKVVEEIDNIRGSAVELGRNNLPSGIYYIELRGKTAQHAKILIR
jgi:PKD repeat protein